MYKLEEICELIRLVGSTGVASVEIDHGGTKLRIEGPPPVTQVVADTTSAPSYGTAAVLGEQMAAVRTAASPGVEAEPEDEDLHYVTSPIVGTFYRAPSPDSDPYVKVGQEVDKGVVLCIVEAMKLMNEIESDAAGTIVKIFPENAEPVEFGQRLFAIRRG